MISGEINPEYCPLDKQGRTNNVPLFNKGDIDKHLDDIFGHYLD